MRPSPDLVLNHAFAKIATEMAPALPPGYGQGSATTTGVLLLMLAQEFNRAAAIRKAENDDMRALFADVPPDLPASFSDGLQEASRGADTDLSVAALDKSNGALKGLLIALHVHAEATGNHALDRRIVQLMQRWATQRQVFLPAM
jgi:hypothetical protein